MRKFLAKLVLVGAALLGVAQAQTVTVTADLKSMFGAGQGTKTQVCFSLTDGNGHQVSNPRILGSGVIVPTSSQCVLPDGTGHVSTSLYANDQIDPANTIYSVQYIFNGRAVHGDIYQFALADGTENLNTKLGLGVVPVVPAPTGDTVYARIDGQNLPFLASVNSNVGFQVTGTAPLNTFLKGNGTNFVPSNGPASGTGSPTACTNQFVTTFTLNGDAAPTSTCTTDVLASAQHANQGTTTTVLHGNAAGNPAFGSVVSADLNITPTTCTNQFVSALSSAVAATCTTDVLASAQHANQGTTTTVLHGNAAGNPSFGAVALTTDVSGVLPTANGGTGSATTTGAPFGSKYFSGDHIIYGSPSGNDSNDGLSPGTAKLTPQACFDTATSTGTVAGVCMLATGSYSCPTTYYSNLTVLGVPAINSTNFNFSIQNTTLSGTIISCTSGTNHTITTVSNLSLINLAYDFGGAGGGLILNSIVSSNFDHIGVNLAGGASNPAVKLTASGTGPVNNTAYNKFFNLTISTNTTTAATDCVLLTGVTPVLTGVTVTNNVFYGTTCTGKIKNGIRFEINTDTNKFYSVDLNNITTASGDALVFNSATPASDQDADNEILEGFCTNFAFNNLISSGQAFGNHVQMCSGSGEVAIHTLGGTPDIDTTVETTGIFGIPSWLAVPNLRVKNQLILNGSTSGTVTIKAPATAGSSNVTLPVTAGDTLVVTSSADTLQNKTLTGAGSGNKVTLLNEQGPASAITGTGADATVYTFTIPANTIQAGKGIHVRVWAAHTTGTASVTWKLTFGATTFYNNAQTAQGTGYWEANIFNNSGVQTAQHSSGFVTLPGTTTFGPVGGQTAAENTAGSVVVKMTFNVAATDTVTPQQFIVELAQ